MGAELPVKTWATSPKKLSTISIKPIEVDPKLENIYANRRDTYVKSGNYQQAMNNYNKALELTPENAKVYIGRGISL